MLNLQNLIRATIVLLLSLTAFTSAQVLAQDGSGSKPVRTPVVGGSAESFGEIVRFDAWRLGKLVHDTGITLE